MLFWALTRNDVANYVSALFLVYIILIFLYILMNLIFSMGVRMPYGSVVGMDPELPARRL